MYYRFAINNLSLLDRLTFDPLRCALVCRLFVPIHRSLVVARQRRDDILSYPDNGHGALFLASPAKLARTGNRLKTGALSILAYEPLHVYVQEPGLSTSNHTIGCREAIMSVHMPGIHNTSYDT